MRVLGTSLGPRSERICKSLAVGRLQQCLSRMLSAAETLHVAKGRELRNVEA